MPPIEAVIDSARARHEPAGLCLELAGWAFARKGYVVAVQVWENDTLLGYIPLGFPRPDVRLHFGSECHTDDVGFEGCVNLLASISSPATVDFRVVFVTDLLERREAPVTLAFTDQTSEPPAAIQHLGVTDDDKIDPPNLQPRCEPARKLVAPNFFILGAAKCGTTSLYHALKQHPQIHMPHVKEPSFFSGGFQTIKNPVEYFNLFPAQEGKSRYGEASHVYFSAPETPSILRLLFPDAKFIVILRNPVNRSYSLYQHMRRSGDEPLETFERALEAEEARFLDPAFRDNCQQYFWNFMYCRSSLFDQQLRRYLDHFPLQQFFVLTLGEWKSGPEHWLKEIFQFLEIDSSVQVNAEPQNEAHGYPVLADETRQKLTMKFQGVRERVENMIGRELDGWEY